MLARNMKSFFDTEGKDDLITTEYMSKKGRTELMQATQNNWVKRIIELSFQNVHFELKGKKRRIMTTNLTLFGQKQYKITSQ